MNIVAPWQASKASRTFGKGNLWRNHRASLCLLPRAIKFDEGSARAERCGLKGPVWTEIAVPQSMALNFTDRSLLVHPSSVHGAETMLPLRPLSGLNHQCGLRYYARSVSSQLVSRATSRSEKQREEAQTAPSQDIARPHDGTSAKTIPPGSPTVSVKPSMDDKQNLTGSIPPQSIALLGAACFCLIAVHPFLPFTALLLTFLITAGLHSGARLAVSALCHIGVISSVLDA